MRSLILPRSPELPMMLSRGLFRPRPLPSGVPFGVRSVGSTHAGPGQQGFRKLINFVELFWSVAGEARIRMDGRDWTMPANHLAFNLPGSEHFHFTEERSWECRWMTLDGPIAIGVILGFGFDTTRPQPADLCPTSRFDNLETIVRCPGPAAEREASALAYSLLTTAAGFAQHQEGAPTPGLIDAALKYIHESGDDLNFGVAELAEHLGVHRSVLSRHFQKQLGRSPAAYLGSVRLQRATHMLEHTDLAVGAIAHQIGFRDAGYLARLMQREYGLTPTEYRQRCQLRQGAEEPPSASE